MSEKRFKQGGDTHIIDTKTGAEYYAPCETELIDLLNEQEQVINDKNKEIKILEQKIKILREEIQSTKQILKMQVDKLEGY